MKLRWIKLTFQRRLYIFSLTIVLAVCSTEGRNDSDFIGNFNHTPSAIPRNLSTEHWNVNETDGTGRERVTTEKNNSFNHHTNQSSSTTSFTPVIAYATTDETLGSVRDQELKIGNSTVNFNDSTTSTWMAVPPSKVSQSIYNQTSASNGRTTEFSTNHSGFQEENSSTEPWFPHESITLARTTNETNNNQNGTTSLPLSLYAITNSSGIYENILNITKPEYWSFNNTNSSTLVYDSSNYSPLDATTQKVWGFPFHKARSGTFNSSTSNHTTISPGGGATTITTLSNNTARPSAKKSLTGTPLQQEFSTKFEREEPWKKTDTLTAHGQNHFNSIVNVRVDSSAETLDKMIRLEAMIAKKMNEMEKMAKLLAGDLKSRLNRIEETMQRSKETATANDVQEVKQYLDSLIDVKIETIAIELKKFKCSHNAQTANEPIKPTIVELRNLLTPPMVEGRNLDSNKDGLADWRAKRTKLMERWESNFQRGFSSKRKLTKRSTRNQS